MAELSEFSIVLTYHNLPEGHWLPALAEQFRRLGAEVLVADYGKGAKYDTALHTSTFTPEQSQSIVDFIEKGRANIRWIDDGYIFSAFDELLGLREHLVFRAFDISYSRYEGMDNMDCRLNPYLEAVKNDLEATEEYIEAVETNSRVSPIKKVPQRKKFTIYHRHEHLLLKPDEDWTHISRLASLNLLDPLFTLRENCFRDGRRPNSYNYPTLTLHEYSSYQATPSLQVDLKKIPASLLDILESHGVTSDPKTACTWRETLIAMQIMMEVLQSDPPENRPDVIGFVTDCIADHTNCGSHSQYIEILGHLFQELVQLYPDVKFHMCQMSEVLDDAQGLISMADLVSELTRNNQRGLMLTDRHSFKGTTNMAENALPLEMVDDARLHVGWMIQPFYETCAEQWNQIGIFSGAVESHQINDTTLVSGFISTFLRKEKIQPQSQPTKPGSTPPPSAGLQ